MVVKELREIRKKMFDEMEQRLNADRKSEDLCDELLDDMDFYYNKVKCCKIESAYFRS